MKKVIFVGAFKKAGESGNVGGQMFACKSLINSDLSDEINWLLIDTTAESNMNRKKSIRILKAVKRMVKYIWVIITNRPSAVILFSSSGWSFYEKGLMLKIGSAFRIKTILAPRSGYIIDEINNNESFYKYAGTVFSKATYILCQGEYWKQFFKEKFAVNGEKLIVQKNWIDPAPYNERSTERLIDFPLHVLFLGWIDENKGIFDILKVAEAMSDKPIIFHLAGHGKDYDQVKSLVEKKQLGNVKLLGWVLEKEKIKLLSSVDIMILPSYREGLPNALLEGMASSLLVLASNVGAIPEVIEDGENGFLLKPGDVEKFESLLNNIIESPGLISNLGTNARKTILDEHSLEVATDTFRKLLI